VRSALPARIGLRAVRRLVQLPQQLDTRVQGIHFAPRLRESLFDLGRQTLPLQSVDRRHARACVTGAWATPGM
jgi:hypothetical protein